MDERLRGRWLSYAVTQPGLKRKRAAVLLIKIISRHVVIVAEKLNNAWTTRQMPLCVRDNKLMLGDSCQFYILNIADDEIQLFNPFNWTVYHAARQPDL